MPAAGPGPPADGPLAHHRPMLKAVARVLLLRVLPRRILPIVTVVEAVIFLRSIRNRSRVRVNAPTASRTAPPVSTSADRPPAPDRRA
jgi:hypothetical protein